MHTQRKVILSAEMPQRICVNPSDLFSPVAETINRITILLNWRLVALIAPLKLWMYCCFTWTLISMHMMPRFIYPVTLYTWSSNVRTFVPFSNNR